MYSWYTALPLTGSYSRFGMSTQTDRCFSRKSSGKYGHGIRLNQVNRIFALYYGPEDQTCETTQTTRPERTDLTNANDRLARAADVLLDPGRTDSKANHQVYEA